MSETPLASRTRAVGSPPSLLKGTQFCRDAPSKPLVGLTGGLIKKPVLDYGAGSLRTAGRDAGWPRVASVSLKVEHGRRRGLTLGFSAHLRTAALAEQMPRAGGRFRYARGGARPRREPSGRKLRAPARGRVPGSDGRQGVGRVWRKEFHWPISIHNPLFRPSLGHSD